MSILNRLNIRWRLVAMIAMILAVTLLILIIHSFIGCDNEYEENYTYYIVPDAYHIYMCICSGKED